MTLNCDAKFEEPTCHGKNDITNLVNIHVSTQNSQICTLLGYLCPKSRKY